MKRQAFQPGEIRDENDAIIRTGTYGKKSAFATADNKGILDYMINNFDALFDMISGACVYVDELPTSGDTDKLYVVKSTGKTYRWDGKQFILVSEAVNGLSAYEIAKQNGFTGTEKEWLESIRGEKGEGITGATVDSDGYLILTLGTDTTIKTALKPLVDAKQYADNAAASATQAGESEANAATSLSQAKASASQASDSATAAANSATAAANSAREQQADWNVTDTTSKAFIKNKPTKWPSSNIIKPWFLNGTDDPVIFPLINYCRANRLAFLPADQIIIEQTVDGGQTWADAGYTDSLKSCLFSGLKLNWFNIPKLDGNVNTLCGLRVTITANKYNVPSGTAETEKYNYWDNEHYISSERYCTLTDFWFWVSSMDNSISIKIEAASRDNPNSWIALFNHPEWGATGWSGSDYCRISPTVFGGGSGQPSQLCNYRFTFTTKPPNGKDTLSTQYQDKQCIACIMGYGECVWGAPNAMMELDHLYYWDNKQNATFPANINAKGKLLENGQSITDSIAKQITTNTLTATDATFTGITSVPTANQGNSSNAIASTEFVAKSISALVNGAPEQLNTLNELATALGNDSNFSATITAELGKKLDESEASDTYVTKTLWQSSQNDMGAMLYQFTNQLQRNKEYKVGDIAYSPSLPSWAYLECTTAGTTGDEEPDFSSVSSTGGAIADMADGNVHWRVRDTRCRYEVGDIIAKTTTPKSYEYLLPCDGSSFDTNKYPLLAKVFANGKVPNLTDGRFLEGGASAGTSKNAGIPNVTATVINHFIDWNLHTALSVKDGAVYVSNPNNNIKTQYTNSEINNEGEYTGDVELTFDLSKGNAIYGASDTVQPKSFTVMYYVCYGG